MGVVDLAHGLEQDVEGVLVEGALLLHCFLQILPLHLPFAQFHCYDVPHLGLLVVHQHLRENPPVHVEPINFGSKLRRVVCQDRQQHAVVAHFQELLPVALENYVDQCALHVLDQGLD